MYLSVCLLFVDVVDVDVDVVVVVVVVVVVCCCSVVCLLVVRLFPVVS